VIILRKQDELLTSGENREDASREKVHEGIAGVRSNRRRNLKMLLAMDLP
jgi:hypothetical protein